jgi:hypothetical protein
MSVLLQGPPPCHLNITSTTTKSLHSNPTNRRKSTRARGWTGDIGRPYLTHLCLDVLEVALVQPCCLLGEELLCDAEFFASVSNKCTAISSYNVIVVCTGANTPLVPVDIPRL